MRILRAWLTALLLTAPLPAFAAWGGSSSPVIPQEPRAAVLQITATNTAPTSPASITPGANGMLVTGIGCTNTDTNPYTLTITRTRSAVTTVLATVTLAASVGNVAGTPAQAILTLNNFPWAPLQGNGSPQLMFEGSNGTDGADTFSIATSGAVASGKTVTCVFQGSNF